MASQERWTAAAAEVLGTPVTAAVPLARRRPGGGVLMLLGFVAFAVVVVLFVSGIVPGPRLLAYFLGALVMSFLIQLGQEPVFAAQTADGIQLVGSSRWSPHPTGPALGPLDPATVDGPRGVFRNAFVIGGVLHRTSATQRGRFQEMLGQRSR